MVYEMFMALWKNGIWDVYDIEKKIDLECLIPIFIYPTSKFALIGKTVDFDTLCRDINTPVHIIESVKLTTCAWEWKRR